MAAHQNTGEGIDLALARPTDDTQERRFWRWKMKVSILVCDEMRDEIICRHPFRGEILNRL
jgi:hypothetical protein